MSNPQDDKTMNDLTLNQCLARLGLTSATAKHGLYQRRILRGDVEIFCGTAHDVWQWLHASRDIIHCEDCIHPCPLHGVKFCAACHKHAGECDYGGCLRHADPTYTFVWSRERRTFCETHGKSPEFAFARAGGTQLTPSTVKPESKQVMFTRTSPAMNKLLLRLAHREHSGPAYSSGLYMGLGGAERRTADALASRGCITINSEGVNITDAGRVAIRDAGLLLRAGAPVSFQKYWNAGRWS